MLPWRFMESHQSICQAGLTAHDGCFPSVDPDRYGRFAPRNFYRYDELPLLDHVPDESDFAVDPSVFKRGLERLDERPP